MIEQVNKITLKRGDVVIVLSEDGITNICVPKHADLKRPISGTEFLAVAFVERLCDKDSLSWADELLLWFIAKKMKNPKKANANKKKKTPIKKKKE